MDASSLASVMASNTYGATGASSSVTAAALTGGKTMDVDKVSKDFESMFLSQMLESMFGDSSGDSAFGDATTNDVYKGLMMEQYGKAITKAGGIGIASYVKQELLKLQEAGS